MQIATARAVTPPAPPEKTTRICPICEEHVGGPWCDGIHPELTVIEADLIDVTFGGAR